MSVFTNDVTVEAGSTNIPVTGTVAVSNFPATQPVSGTVSATQGTSPWVISGSVTTSSASGATATITRVATTAASVLLLATNSNRKKAVIMTETGSANYVAFAATATTTAYTYLLGTTTVLEVTNYTGPISLIRGTGTGNVQVTEIV